MLSTVNNTQSDLLLALQRRLEVLEEQSAVQKLLSRSNTQVEVLIDLQRRVAVLEEHNCTIPEENNLQLQPSSKLTPILGKRFRRSAPKMQSFQPDDVVSLELPCDVVGELTFKASKRYQL